MEKSVEWIGSIYQENSGMKQMDPKQYSPLVLAYIGDCVFDLIV